MGILVYILTPVVAYLLNLVLSLIVPIIMFPITKVIIKSQKNPQLFSFRPDMLAIGIIKGFLTVYFLLVFLSHFKLSVNQWWLYLTFIVLAYVLNGAWNKRNPFAYEFSLNASPIIGHIIGLTLIHQ